jgi:hypothetical protein
MSRRTRIALAVAAVSVAACAKKEQPPVDTAAAAAAAAPAPAPAPAVTLADFAGRWNLVTKPESGPDTTVTKVVLIAADTGDWVMETPTKLKVKHHVTLSGDSVMLKSEPYASMRRKGKQVWTESVYRLQNGKLVGPTIAHYANSGADSVLRLTTEGTKQ